MKKTIIVILTVVLLLACDNNKTRQTESVVFDNHASVDQSMSDTLIHTSQNSDNKSISVESATSISGAQ